jgi:hypothetical protein
MGQFDSLRNGSVACWLFSGNARDEYGNNDGVIYSAELASDRFGRSACAYSFNGINSFIQVNGANFNFYNDFSISLWLNPHFTVQNGWASVISKSHLLDGGSAWVLVRYSDTNKFYFDYRELNYNEWSWWQRSGGNTEGTTATLNYGAWNHIVITKQGKQTIYFINGSLQAALTTRSELVKLNTDSLIVGSDNMNLNPFKGFIDDIYIYKRALSLSEVSLLYNMPVTVGGSCFPNTSTSASSSYTPDISSTPFPSLSPAVNPSPSPLPSSYSIQPPRDLPNVDVSNDSKNSKSFVDTAAGIGTLMGGIAGLITAVVLLYKCCRSSTKTGAKHPVGIALEEGRDIGLIRFEDSTTYFDYDNDGKSERTSWVSNKDAILVYDHDNNKQVDKAAKIVLTSWCPRLRNRFCSNAMRI